MAVPVSFRFQLEQGRVGRYGFYWKGDWRNKAERWTDQIPGVLDHIADLEGLSVAENIMAWWRCYSALVHHIESLVESPHAVKVKLARIDKWGEKEGWVFDLINEMMEMPNGADEDDLRRLCESRVTEHDKWWFTQPPIQNIRFWVSRPR